MRLCCWRNKLLLMTSAAFERRRLCWRLCVGCVILLLAWSLLLQNGLELRDIPVLLRDRDAPFEIRAALPKASVSASGCPANASCIAFATRAFGSYSYWNGALQPGLVPSCASDCRVLADPSEAHALLFHGFDLPSRRRLRQMRQTQPSSQLWIYYSQESPVHLLTNRCVRDCLISPWLPFAGSALAFVKEFAFPSYLLRNYPDTTEEAGYFNWTVTYRRDSTIYLPHSRLARATNNQEYITLPPTVSLAVKRHLSFIVVSNCHPFNRRPEILSELSKHMELHIYGSCGDRVLPARQSIADLSKQYYFHLSFENAFCRDYITEKFFSNGLNGHAVPVTFAGYSREDIEAVAPPHSFLYAGDFKSPMALAERLKSLAAYPTEYSAYHRWRSSYGFVNQDQNPSYNLFCQICRKLRESHADSAMHLDLNRFYNSGRQCRPPNYYPFHR